MIQLELDPKLQAELEQEARSKGLDLNGYVASIVTERAGRQPVYDPEAIRRAIEGIRELQSHSLPGPESMKDLVNEGRRF